MALIFNVLLLYHSRSSSSGFQNDNSHVVFVEMFLPCLWLSLLNCEAKTMLHTIAYFGMAL